MSADMGSSAQTGALVGMTAAGLLTGGATFLAFPAIAPLTLGLTAAGGAAIGGGAGWYLGRQKDKAEAKDEKDAARAAAEAEKAKVDADNYAVVSRNMGNKKDQTSQVQSILNRTTTNQLSTRVSTSESGTAQKSAAPQSQAPSVNFNYVNSAARQTSILSPVMA